MPMYSYECSKCGSVVELLRKMDEKEDEVSCEKDNTLMTFIIAGAPNIRKGAGIYSVDISSGGSWGDFK